MKCQICGASNPERAKACQSCGSSLSARGGADIVLRNDGSVDHAGDSRWKAGGLAGAGALAGLLKFKGASLALLKIFYITRLFSLIGHGGAWALVGVAALAALLVVPLWRSRRQSA